MNTPTCNCLRSHIFIHPSSPPDTMNGSVRFQLMTLTSRSWASDAVIIHALLGAALVSQILILLSTEQEAKTWGKAKHFNPLRAKFLRENINIYLHFMSFLHTNKTQVAEIPPRVRQGPAYSTWSISWLLMSWRRKEPGHQQPWYWPS